MSTGHQIITESQRHRETLTKELEPLDGYIAFWSMPTRLNDPDPHFRQAASVLTAKRDALTYALRAMEVRDELLVALKELRADVIGSLGIGVSDCIGHTNARVLGDKCQAAFEAIAKAEGSSDVREG